jgi:hypothetical protein
MEVDGAHEPIDLLKSVKAMSAAELKKTLSRRDLDTTGRKPALCERLVSDMLYVRERSEREGGALLRRKRAGEGA